ncbi:MAG: NTP transferase domain-containing protein [Candidatus Heimdallarchaeota archaeon]|nr:MAG: NTP transferase domain-containing protein [Candidatus Heimdallarchaeota archaeon]
MTVYAFILAAGEGSRLYPFSYSTPKPMLPLLNKPIIQHSIERLLEAGIQNIGIVIQRDDKIIPSFVDMTFPDLNPLSIVQEKALGTAHAVLQVEEYLSTKHFLVIAGDSLFSPSFLRELSRVHVKERNDITLSLEKMEFNLMKESSTVDYRNGRVLEIREKPQTPAEILSDLNSAALYIFSKLIFDMIKGIEKTNRGEYELATVINKTIRHGGRVGGVITKRVCHISTSHDLWRFNMKFLHKIQNGRINENIIGKNVCIDESVVLKNSILGDNSVVEKGVMLTSSVVLPNTIIDRNYENSLVQSDYYECYTDSKRDQTLLE